MNTTIKNMISKIAVVAVFIAIWQMIYYMCVDVFNIWKTYAFPSPMGVWKLFVSMISNNTLLVAVLYTMKRLVAGFVIAAALGFILGFVISRYEAAESLLKPLCLGVQTLPSICWVPFAILWFGINEKAIVFVTVMGAMFSIAISVDNAIKSVNASYIKVAKTMGIGEVDLYFKVIFPASRPNLITGLKQGWSFAWRALISGEVISASVGLGNVLILGRNLGDINQVVLVMIVIVVLGIIIDRLIFRTLEKKCERDWGNSR